MISRGEIGCLAANDPYLQIELIFTLSDSKASVSVSSLDIGFECSL